MLDKRLFMSSLGDNREPRVIWHGMCNMSRHKPNRAIEIEGEKMKKTPVKKGSKLSTVKPLKGNLGKLSITPLKRPVL
jgi:hypothetical protein